MKHVLTVLVLVAGLITAAAGPSSATAPTCTQGDVTRLAQAGPHFARQSLESSPAVAGETWTRCQFRLYDDNDDPESPDNPEVPHVFTDEDHVLAGIFLFELYDAFDRPDYDRAAAIAYLQTITDRFFFGPLATPDTALPELPLTTTNYRSGVFPLIGGHIVWNHRYATFTPGSLPPGNYHWRHEQHDPVLNEDFIARGSLTILNN